MIKVFVIHSESESYFWERGVGRKSQTPTLTAVSLVSPVLRAFFCIAGPYVACGTSISHSSFMGLIPSNPGALCFPSRLPSLTNPQKLVLSQQEPCDSHPSDRREDSGARN